MLNKKTLRKYIFKNIPKYFTNRFGNSETLFIFALSLTLKQRKMTTTIKDAVFSLACSISAWFEKLLGVDYEAQKMAHSFKMQAVDEQCAYIRSMAYSATWSDYGMRIEQLNNCEKMADNLTAIHGTHPDVIEAQNACKAFIKKQRQSLEFYTKLN